jgi:GNAT superfamily N-acetyltransferase
MLALFEARAAFGYLAYVDGRAAGWVNAASRLHQALYRRDVAEPPDHEVVSVSCFNIAPPYREHGIAGTLLDQVIVDAPERGARWIEAYPFNEAEGVKLANHRGVRSLFDARGFDAIKVRERDTVVRRPA